MIYQEKNRQIVIPDGVEAINCIEEYKEFLYKRVNMIWDPNGEHK